MLLPGFQQKLDSDTSGGISKEEFIAGFDRFFQAWDVKQQGFLDGDAVRDGITKDLIPSFGPPPGAAPAPAQPTDSGVARARADWLAARLDGAGR